MAREYKYTDINHPPVPELKVGDHCYATSGYNVQSISTCEIRRVNVVWEEPRPYIDTDVPHWRIDYYIRMDVDKPLCKSTVMSAFGLDDEHLNRIYLTPQEAMEELVKRFKETVALQAEQIREEMRRIGYTKAESRKLLDYRLKKNG